MVSLYYSDLLEGQIPQNRVQVVNPLENNIEDYTKSAINSAPMVVQGITSGFILMAVPMLLLGVVVGISLLALKVPLRALGGE